MSDGNGAPIQEPKGNIGFVHKDCQTPVVDIDSVKPGDYVKYAFPVSKERQAEIREELRAKGIQTPGINGERMWVAVTEFDGDNVKGTLANDPMYVKGLSYGDEVEFLATHIIGHYPAHE